MVKESDSKSDRFRLRRFESYRCRFSLLLSLMEFFSRTFKSSSKVLGRTASGNLRAVASVSVVTASSPMDRFPLLLSEPSPNYSKLMTCLLELKSSELTSVDLRSFEAMMNLLKRSEPEVCGKFLITAANVAAHQVNRGILLDTVASKTICRLLGASLDCIATLHSVHVSRALRCLTAVDHRESVDDLFAPLLGEILRPERLVSFSAMDLSEIAHSISSLSRRRTGDSLCSDSWKMMGMVMTAVLTEFIERSTYINIRISPRSKSDKQWISIQGLSNISFSLVATISSLALDSRTDIKTRLASVCYDLVANNSEKQAIQSCQPFHVLSIISNLSLLDDRVSKDEVKAVKLLLSELVRKRHSLTEFEEIHQTLSLLEKRWRNLDSSIRNVPLIVRDRLAG